MMLISLWSKLTGGWIAKWLAIIIVGVGAYWGHNTWIKKKAVGEFVTKSKQEAKKRNARAKKIRQKAREPGAAQRLLKSYCRDCG